MKEIITSLDNAKVKKWAKLLTRKGRKDSNTFLIEGPKAIKEAKSLSLVKEVITSNESTKGTLVTPAIIKKITGTVTPQDVVAVCTIPKPKQLGDRVLVLRNIQDPGNVGTLIRTAKSFGFTDVIVQGADPYSDKALRSAQGSILHINVIHTQDAIVHLKGFKTIIGTILDKEAKPYDHIEPKGALALVMGNEGHGLDNEMIDICTEKAYIPINFESLNVAIAGGILMNEYKKQD